MPYSPEPVPPGAISPSIMFSSSVAPARLVYESWKLSTAPVDVKVVAEANTAELGTPKRCSVPSRAEPTAVGTVPWCADWKPIINPADRAASSAITATMAYP